MSAGSVTLGTNLSVAVGPLGRNGEASGSISTNGKVSATYSYSKTRGLFGGVSLEGSVIVERQDANAIAYQSDVTAKQLLSGAVAVPSWARGLIKTLESRTGMPGGRKWIDDAHHAPASYAFDGIPSPSAEQPLTPKLKKRTPMRSLSLSSPNWGKRKSTGYFPTVDASAENSSNPFVKNNTGANPSYGFETHFDSDYTKPETNLIDLEEPQLGPESALAKMPPIAGFESRTLSGTGTGQKKSFAVQRDPRLRQSSYGDNILQQPTLHDDYLSNWIHGDLLVPTDNVSFENLDSQLSSRNSSGKAVALFDYQAKEPGDLSFKRGDIIVITEKSNCAEDWWTGHVDGRSGLFPANFVQVV